MRPLLADVRGLILAARERVAGAVNASLVLLYWEIGRRIRRDILREKRAEYGAEVVEALTERLSAEFGRGFGRRNLFSMIRFAEVFRDPRIVQSLIAQLGWTHFLHIIPIDDPLKRDFYAELCRVERWNTRTLGRKIQSMLFERSALSKKPDRLIRRELATLRAEDTVTPDLVFRDPYFLDFLGLKDSYAERDLEAAILREMESFILELGVGFTFVERQKRITVDGGGLPHRSALLPQDDEASCGDRPQARGVPAGRQRPDGALSAVARQVRAAAGGGGADRSDSVRRHEAGDDRIARPLHRNAPADVEHCD